MRFLVCLLVFSLVPLGAQQTAEQLSDEALRLASQHEMDRAVQLWQQALVSSPHFFPALYNLGYFHYSQQHWAEAQTFLQQAATANPRDFNSRYLLGASCSKLGDVDGAVRAWREALKLEPQNVKLMQIMAVEYEKGRYFGEAAGLAQKLLTLQPPTPDLYFLAIKIDQDAGDYENAAKLAQEAVTKYPDSARANFEYAFHLQLKGKIGDATAYLQRAMKADPSYEEPFFFYGNLLVDQGQNSEAIPYLRTAIKDRNDYVPARVVLARALMNQQLWNDAIAELNQTIALDPKHPQPHLLLSQIYFRLGDEARAKEEKQLSLRLRRENPTVLEAVQSRPFTN